MLTALPVSARFSTSAFTRPLNRIAVAAFVGASLACAAQIQGTVVGENGKPIANARVSVHKTVGGGTNAVAQTVSTGSSKSGSFTVNGVDPADYAVCVEVPGTDYVDPCKWGIAPPTTHVASAAAATNYNAVLTHGATVNVRVEDPEELLPHSADQATNRLLRATIWTKQATRQNVPLLSADKSGHNYSIVVPPDLDLRLTFTAVNLTVVDQKGYVLDPKASWDIRAKAGSTQTLHFRITKPRS